MREWRQVLLRSDCAPVSCACYEVTRGSRGSHNLPFHNTARGQAPSEDSLLERAVFYALQSLRRGLEVVGFRLLMIQTSYSNSKIRWGNLAWRSLWLTNFLGPVGRRLEGIKRSNCPIKNGLEPYLFQMEQWNMEIPDSRRDTSHACGQRYRQTFIPYADLNTRRAWQL